MRELALAARDAASSALPFALGAVAGAAGTAVARAVALRLGFHAAPNPIVPQHKKPVPYLGGAGLAVGAALAWFVADARPAEPSRAAWLVPVAAFLAFGVVDDAVAFRAGRKLALQCACAALAVAAGWVAPVTGVPWLDAALSAAWIVVAVNAVNVTDVCDGLVAGLSLASLLAAAALAPEARVVALAGAGACGGFLWFNKPPATIYLGDAGSHVLGFLLAAAGIVCVRRVTAWPGVPCAALLLGVPLFEVWLLVTARRAKGIPWWRGSSDHLALRLQAAGFSKWRTDALAWGAGAVLALEGVALPRMPVGLQVVALSVTVAAAAACRTKLLGWEVRGGVGSRA